MIRRLLFWVSGLTLVMLFGLLMQVQPVTLADSAYAGERAEQYVWKTLKTGAGGWITGIDISTDGSVVVSRTDVGGAYRWNETTLSWTQIVTADSMPDESYRSFGGVLSIVTAPSKPQRLYMAFNGSIYRSNDAGASWTKTSLTGLGFNANAHYRQQGERLAVHPTDPNLVYFGSPDFTSPQQGLYKSTDGGATWATVALKINDEEINAANINISNVDFDNQGRAYATVDGYGVFRANQAGIWSHISNDPNNPYGPDWAIYQHMDISAEDGTAYFVINKPYTPGNPADPITSSEIWRFRDNSWQKQNPPSPFGGGFSTIAVSPGDSAFVIAFSFGGKPYRSYTSGDSWDQWDALNARLSNSNADISWFNTLPADRWISVSNIIFDPVVPNRLWLGEGTGAWRTTDLFDNEMMWTSISRGIEELVTNDVIAPQGGKVVTAHWDWGSFYHDNVDAYPTSQSTYGRFNSTWDLDYSAGNPSFIVGTITDQRYCCYEDGNFNMSGFSQDGGRNWQRFASYPTGMEFGNIAVAANDTQNIVWVPSSDLTPQYTKNRGASWTPITLPDLPANQSGSHNDPHLNRRVITADRVLDNTFYYYHKDNGVYRSVDGGATWTRMANTNGQQGFPWGYFGVILESVPGRAGHLWMTPGIHTGASYPMKRSSDGGASWNDVPGVEDVTSFGFGKAASANGYPAVYIQGVVNGVSGIYRSINGGDSWLKLATYPLGNYDTIKAISGDMNIFGRVYLGTAGGGFIYGDSVQGTPPTDDPSQETPVPTTPTPEGAFTEYLVNNSLELDTNGDKSPDGWKAKDNELDTKNKLKCKAGSDHARSGVCAYKFKGNTGGSKSKLTYKTSTLELPSVVAYDFSGHVRASNLTTATLIGKAKIVFTDGSEQSIELYPLSAGSAYNPAHATSSFISFGRTPKILKVQFFYASTGGKMWLDDVSFKIFENARNAASNILIDLP
jgi:photosystem II stability/assembly factor-like uncharacterized protein